MSETCTFLHRLLIVKSQHKRIGSLARPETLIFVTPLLRLAVTDAATSHPGEPPNAEVCDQVEVYFVVQVLRADLLV